MSLVPTEHGDIEREEIESVAVLTNTSAGALNKSEVEAQLDAAHKYRRSIKHFLNEAGTLATLTQEIAESCIYSLPRGGKPITGPSVRLAEICASAYGNLHVGARVVGVEEKEIVAQGVCWDLEKNLRATIETRRRITKKNGARFDDDMIVVTGNAAASIALRNAIFRVIPKAYVQMVYDKAREVAVGSASTLAARRATVFDRLQKMGAFQDRILARIGKPSIDDVTVDDLETLIGLGTAIKSGDATVDETFPAAQLPEKGKVNLDDLKPSKEPNRGHGNENLGSTGNSAGDAAPIAEVNSTTSKAPEIQPDSKPGDMDAKCSDEQFNMIEKARIERDIDLKILLGYVKGDPKTGGLGYKMLSQLKQKDFLRVMQFLQNGGEVEGHGHVH